MATAPPSKASTRKPVSSSPSRIDRIAALSEDLLRLLVNTNGAFPGKRREAAKMCAEQAHVLYMEVERIERDGLSAIDVEKKVAVVHTDDNEDDQHPWEDDL